MKSPALHWIARRSWTLPAVALVGVLTACKSGGHY